MIAAYSSSAVYVGPFARSWPGLSITDLDHMQSISALYLLPLDYTTGSGDLARGIKIINIH
jgi:hypothetical protein